MEIRSATFEKSSAVVGQCPTSELPEIAFIGRSNVGKSSLINLLCGAKGLAKTSSTPGKTQLINHFLVNGEWYLVDLPGYGFASVSKGIREGFGQMIGDYLLKRRNLVNTFVLIDLRLAPQEIDLRFIQWMGESGLPFTIVFTKADKLRGSEVQNALKKYREILSETWEELPPMITCSAHTGIGRKEILSAMQTAVAAD